MRHPLALALPAAFAAALSLSACWPEEGPSPLIIAGETMGTTYNVVVSDPPEDLTAETLKSRVDGVLAEVNAQMSNWDPDSEISRFNADAGTAPVPASPELLAVMTRANAVHALSQGRFDVTLAPLIELWGFGPRQPDDPVPAEAEIAAALASVGQATLLAVEDGALRKLRPGVTVNLSAIAKGHGADRVAAALRDGGMENYLVEIGGDLVAAGQNPAGEAWTIGVEQPLEGDRRIETVVQIGDAGMATSGDYRNYFEQDGVRYSHIIDPTTGRPIDHRTASVTVVAEDAMSADALATAFLALGEEAGRPIAEGAGIAVLFITRGDGGFVTSATSAFPAISEVGG